MDDLNSLKLVVWIVAGFAVGGASVVFGIQMIRPKHLSKRSGRGDYFRRSVRGSIRRK